ncbi:MAG: acetyl-CoA hydrolase/transferase C-terminal domain-containing protein [Xanthomonadales bacterium]|nr:acetyl-CoA hydrolase/transferase C-terminal domain-containing protein [Xanthomonadales bacterium]
MTESSTLDRIVDWALLRLGKQLVIGTPLGLGKPNEVLNAFYRRACADPSIDLQIVTALSLDVPQGDNEFEQRFVAPFAERHFGPDYPRLGFAVDQAAQTLPENVRVIEFYFQSGSRLGNSDAQRNYISSNYTHVARDFVSRGANLILQMVAAGEHHGEQKLSLSCNADVTLELKARLERQPDHRCLFIAQIHQELPFMHGDAIVDRDFFDCIVEPKASHRLFAVPRGPVTTRDHWIGLHASALIPDSSTLQIGIGSLSDALVYALQLRNEHNDLYRPLLEAGGTEQAGTLIDQFGGRGVFEDGIFGASEMFMDGFMHLYKAGILKRQAYNDEVLQELADRHELPDAPTRMLLEKMWEGRTLPRHIDRESLAHLKRLGILSTDVRLEDDTLVRGEARVPNDLAAVEHRDQLSAHFLASELAPGMLLEAAFFLGSAPFYRWLLELEDDERPHFLMSGVKRINQLYGGREELEIAQRRRARFVNTCMMMTLTGSAVSDGLKDVQMVSGVGGQYNFVAMGHALPEGRSILMLRSVRGEGADAKSNIVWEYPYTTIPRHLRDIVITEYGIADLRGRTDEECIEAMLAITDSAFQAELAEQAKQAGKLRGDYQVSAHAQNNNLERLDRMLAAHRTEDRFQLFPFGSDFDDLELQLIGGLKKLKAASASKLTLLKAVLTGSPARYPAPLGRMGLDAPRSVKERILARLLAWGLRESET